MSERRKSLHRVLDVRAAELMRHAEAVALLLGHNAAFAGVEVQMIHTSQPTLPSIQSHTWGKVIEHFVRRKYSVARVERLDLRADAVVQCMIEMAGFVRMALWSLRLLLCTYAVLPTARSRVPAP